MYCLLQFDPEGFGEIPWTDFLQTLQNPDFIAQVPPHKREVSALTEYVFMIENVILSEESCHNKLLPKTLALPPSSNLLENLFKSLL